MEIPSCHGKLKRFHSIGDGSCFYHSLLFATSQEYREENAKTKREMVRELRNNIIHYLRSPDPNFTGREALAQIIDTHAHIDEKSRGYSIMDGETLFDSYGVLLEPETYRNKDGEYIEKKHFTLVSKQAREYFLPNSRYFTMNKGEFALNSFGERFYEFSSHKPDYKYKKKNESKESLEPMHIIKSLKQFNCWAREHTFIFILYILCLNLIIFTEKDEIEAKIELDEDYPYIFMYRISDVHYDACGVFKDGKTRFSFKKGRDKVLDYLL